MDVRDRVVVVTGGASGIGRAMSRAFAGRGAAGVAVADIDGAGAEWVAEELRSAGHTALAATVNVADEGEVVALVEEVERTFGPVDLWRCPTETGSGCGRSTCSVMSTRPGPCSPG